MVYIYNDERYDEHECYGSKSCSDCQEYQDRLAIAQEYLEKLMKNLCGPFVINNEQVEDCLMELCDKLEVDYPHGWSCKLVKAKSLFHKNNLEIQNQHAFGV